MSKEDTLLNEEVLSDIDRALYQKNIGELVWITHTLPELMFAYKLKARKNTRPTALDMNTLITLFGISQNFDVQVMYL